MLFRHPAYHDLFWNGDLALLKAVLHEFGGLAGQLGFFDTYIVEFNRKAMSVILK